MPNPRSDHERIVEAAERSLADGVIEKLPKGYDQVIGKRFGTGVDPSGGEEQKIAIARAYVDECADALFQVATLARRRVSAYHSVRGPG